MNWEEALATGHVVAATSALVAGAAVLVLPKGKHLHRSFGAVYVLALVLVNVAALSLHRENAFGVFHVLAVLSLLTIAVGLLPLTLGKRSPTVIATHAYCLAGSYAGLVAAGCGQLVVVWGRRGSGDWVVPAAIGAVLSFSCIIIFVRVPPLVDRMLGG